MINDSDEYFCELEEIKNIHNGNHFKKVDLHVHSPASKDTKWGEINEYEFLNYFIEARYDLIAITDHNNGDWIDIIKKASKELRRRNKWNISILPGLEITTSGIHLTVIFPENTTTDKINHFLSKIEIGPEQRGKLGFPSKKNPIQICEIAHDKEFNGIVVGAHCSNSNNGVVGKLGGEDRQQALDNLDMLELKPSSFEELEKKIKYVREDLGYKDMPFIISSDCHGLEEIHSNTCWLKMDKCNYQGLKQILFEPDLRCSYKEPKKITYPYLLGISINGSLYKNQKIAFNPNLNVLIGGRGSGKSALIDILRFCFGLSPIIKEDNHIFIDRITNFLNIGDNVRVFCYCNNSEYIIERIMDYKEIGSDREITSLPNVYEVRKPPLKLDISPSDLLQLEIFSQGEVFGLTKKVEDQRKLIDEYIDINGTINEESILLAKLKDNSDEIIQIGKDLDINEEIAENKESTIDRIRELENYTDNDIFKLHEKWEEEKRFFDSSMNKEIDINERLNNLNFDIPIKSEAPSKTMNYKLIKEYEKNYGLIEETSKKRLIELNSDINSSLKKLTAIREKWKFVYQDEDVKFKEKLKEMGFTDSVKIFNELQDKKSYLKYIEEEIEPIIKKLENNLINYQNERKNLLEELKRVRKEISNKRLAFANMTNSKLSDVKITIKIAEDPSEFLNKLNTLYSKSGIKNKEKIWFTLLKNGIDPLSLVDIILSEDFEKLNSFEISEDAAFKIIRYLPIEKIFELQVVKMEDIPIISLKKEGEYDFTPLNHLSFGEKCSAILSIILIEKESPLVIDQPEDELDHSFIKDNIVDSILKIKNNRQLLISTHNPNIPVLGDGELIIKLKKVPGINNCVVENAGGLEDPEIINHLKRLEGGTDALLKRGRKYGLKFSS